MQLSRKLKLITYETGYKVKRVKKGSYISITMTTRYILKLFFVI